MKKNRLLVITLIILMIMTPLTTLAAEIYNTDSNRQNYGSNFYGTSNIREWLNSYETDVSYTHNEPADSNVNSGRNSYESEKGFLADGNFTELERSMIAPRTHKVLLSDIDSNVKDGGTTSHNYVSTNISLAVDNYHSSYYKVFTDRVFLLSVNELNNWVANRGWDYKAKPTAQAIANSEYSSSSFNESSYWYYWLNTPRASHSSHVRYVHSSGAVNRNHAYNYAVGVRPALNLKSEISKSSGAATLSDPAVLGTSGEPLEIGDYVTMGSYYNQPITWRVINKDTQGTVLFAENILTIKPFDANGDGTYPELANTYGEIAPLPDLDTTPPEEVSNLTETHSETSVTLSWDNPVDEDFSSVIVYQDDVEIQTDVTAETTDITDLEPGTSYTFKVVTVDESGNKSDGTTITVTTDEFDTAPPEEVNNLAETHTETTITLTWDNPTNEDFNSVIVYQDGIEIQTNVTAETIEITDLEPNTSYTFKVVTIDELGNKSSGSTITVTTKEIMVDEVINLKAEAEHDRVNLSWELPESDYFHHVNIYRKQVEEESFFEGLFGATTVSAAETDGDYSPMFETNGTYWNDLTVAPSTTYEYRLTSESTLGEESEGQIIQATTLAEPLPTIEDAQVILDDNEDYLVTWTDNELAENVKVMIDGVEYATVSAADGSYTIPKDDMVVGLSGLKLKLIPLKDNGTEGLPIKPTETSSMGLVSLPFSVTDLLKTVMSLIAWVGPFILLALAIHFAPRIIEFLRGVFAKYKGGKYRL